MVVMGLREGAREIGGGGGGGWGGVSTASAVSRT